MRIALALLLAAAVAVPAEANDYLRSRPKPKEGFRYPDCFCTLRGERVEIGEERCLRVDGRTFTARCDMSLNNTTWREVREGCDARSSWELRRTPTAFETRERKLC